MGLNSPKPGPMLTLAAVAVIAGFFGARMINKAKVKEEASSSIVMVDKNARSTQARVRACIENESANGGDDPPEEHPFSLISYGITDFEAALFEAVIQKIELDSDSYSTSDYPNAQTCQTEHGTAFYETDISTNPETCIIQPKGTFTLIIPMQQGDESEVIVEKIRIARDSECEGLEEMNTASSQLFLVLKSHGNPHKKKPLQITASIAVKLTGQEREEKASFLEIPISEEIEKQLGGKWEEFAAEIIKTAQENERNTRLRTELEKYDHDVHAMLEDYIANLEIHKRKEVKNESVENLEREKEELVERFYKLYEYLLETSGEENKNEIIETFYRFLKCSPVKTLLNPYIRYDGLATSQPRQLMINPRTKKQARTWMHEIAHKVTLENFPSEYDCVRVISPTSNNYPLCSRVKEIYAKSSRKVFNEGVATLTTWITDTETVHNPTKDTQEYRDFTILTAAFIGREGYAQSMIEQDGFKKIIEDNFDKNLDKFIEKWGIDPKYKQDLLRVYGDGDPLKGLKEIQMTNYGAPYSERRLLLLKKILENSGTTWKEFVRAIHEEFEIDPIETSIKYF